MSFVKLDSNIVTSSVWSEDSDTLRLWVYLLATAEADGSVRATVPGIATQCRLSVDVVRRTLDKFSSPDPDSRTSKNEGRRIRIQREPQFEIQVLNYADYRKKDHTAAERKRRQRQRERKARLAAGVTRDKRDSHRASQRVTQAEAEAEVPRGSKDSCASAPAERGAGLAAGSSDDLPAGFADFWKAYPRKKSKGKAIRAWGKLKSALRLLPVMLTAIERAKVSTDWLKDGGQYIPYPSTWLNARCWEDEIEVPAAAGDDVPGGARNAAFARDQAEHGVDPRWPAYESAIRAGEREPGTWAGFADRART